jgi:hypothetical protein
MKTTPSRTSLPSTLCGISARVALLALLATTLVVTAPACGTAQNPPLRAAAADSLPSRLSDAEFWTLIGQISETEGDFPSDNFTSNEIEVGPLAALLRTKGISGGVYMGVGPEQNFSYIAAIRPKMAFIVDIRRQALVQHLMYKAVFELSPTRADFVALLFSRAKPAGLDTTSSIQSVWSGFVPVPGDAAAFTRNLTRIRDHITRTHGFRLSSAELASLDYVYESFFAFGPQIGTRGFAGGGGGGRGGRGGGGGGGGRNTSLMNLTQATGADGVVSTFLANEERYRVVRDLHIRNLIVPVSGDFGGPKAIRAVGGYVASKGSRITAFYLSNVEQYLFQDGKSRQFYNNVATLPVDAASVFIRPYAMRTYAMETSLCPIAGFLRAFSAGRITSNNAALGCTPPG